MTFVYFIVFFTCVLCCNTARIQENLLTDKKDQELAPNNVRQIDEGLFGHLRYITVRNNKDIYYVIHLNSTTGKGGSQAEVQNIKKAIQELINAQNNGSKKQRGKKGEKGGKGKNGKGGGSKKSCKAQKCNCNNSAGTPGTTNDGQTTPAAINPTEKPRIDTTSTITTKKPAEPAPTQKGTTEDYYGEDGEADYGDDYY